MFPVFQVTGRIDFFIYVRISSIIDMSGRFSVNINVGTLLSAICFCTYFDIVSVKGKGDIISFFYRIAFVTKESFTAILGIRRRP